MPTGSPLMPRTHLLSHCVSCGQTRPQTAKFACVDGPDFDGHKVDWDESLKRGKMYFDWERHKHEEVCNLFKKEVQ